MSYNTPPPMQPWQQPLYSAQQSVQDIGDSWRDAAARREQIARQIGQYAVQGTTQIVPNPWA